MDSPQSDSPGSRDCFIDCATLLETLQDYGILIFDSDARIRDWNPGAERIFGWTREEMMGADGHILFTPEDRENGQADQEIGTARKTGKAIDERWHIRKSGDRFWASGILYRIRDGKDGVRGFVKVVRDFSERKQAATALLESERKLEFFMENMEDHALFLVNQKGQIASWNPGAERLFGYAAPEALGRPLGALFSGEDAGSGLAEKELAESQRMGKFEAERWQLRKDGGRFWAASVTIPLIDADEELRGYARVTRDATERRRAEEAQRMESIGRLAGGVAHDFNNMLTAINGYAELLSGTEQDGNAAEWISEIRKAGQRAASLTRQLLAFGRKQVLSPTALQLNDVVRAALPLMQRTLGEDVHLLTALDPDLGKVRLDPAQFEQVLLNLALNSREAMPEGGDIVIETANAMVESAEVSEKLPLEPGPHVLLRFRDTGRGMRADVLARVFEPFFTTKARGAGSTGLGLSTAYGVVRQSGGAITAHSEPDRGAEFRIYLPVVPEEEASGRPPAPGKPRAEDSLILIVEDEHAVRKLAARLLAREGYRLAEARDGAEALAWLDAHPAGPDLVVTDVVMPNMGGLELARRMREKKPDLPVLFLSGYAEDAASPDGDPERSAFLLKPFPVKALLSKVRDAVGRRQGA